MAIRAAILSTVIEYLLVVLPIGLYVWMLYLFGPPGEHSIVASPEWNLASIFLALQSVRLILIDVMRSRRQKAVGMIILFLIGATLATVFATVNVALSFPHPSQLATLCMWTELVIVSVAFFVLVTGATLSNPERSLSNGH